MSTALMEVILLAAAGFGGLLLAKRIRGGRLLLAAGPAGVLLWLGWVKGNLPPSCWTLAAAVFLLAGFLALCDVLCRTRRARFLLLLLCAGIGVRLGDQTFNRIWAMQELGRAEPRSMDGVVLQQTGYSCTPAACATCLCLLGVPATELSLAEEGMTTTRGTTFGRMTWVLDRHLAGKGWRTRYAPRAHWADLPRDGAPALLSVDLGGGLLHSVAFLGWKDGKALIGDPLGGVDPHTRARLESRWTGEAVFFTRR